MFGPLYVALLIPVLFLQAPELRLTLEFALVPIVNVALMFRDVIEGIYQWDLIAVTVVTELLTIVIALSIASKILAYEDFLVGNNSATLWTFLKNQLVGRKAVT